MATIGSVLKDQLAVYDQKLQELNRTIDWAYSEIGKTQAARLKLMELMEEAMGSAPEERVVVQKMAFVERRVEEARHIAPPDDGTASRLAKYGTLEERAERKKERDRENYRKRQAKKHQLMPDGWATKILAHLSDVDEPVSLNQIAIHHGVRDLDERQRLRSALGRLKKDGVIANPPGEPQGTGHKATYLLTGQGLGRATHVNGAVAHQ